MKWVKASASAYNGSCVEVAWHKATRSGYSGNCVEVGYTKSSHSESGNCVEAGHGACGMIHVRDSKDPRKDTPEQPTLSFTPEAFADFAAGIRNGEFAG